MFVADNQNDWDEFLSTILFVYSTSPQRDSLFYLLYGREPRLPIDVNSLPPNVDHLSTSIAEHRARIVSQLEEAQRMTKQNTERTQQRMKEHYDLESAPVKYKVGQRVWVFTPKTRKCLSKKLLHHWHGPCRIVKQLSPVNFQLRNTTNRLVSTPLRFNCMKLYYEAKDRPITLSLVNDDDDKFSLTEDELPSDSFESELPNNKQAPDDHKNFDKAQSMTDTPTTQHNALDELSDAPNEDIYQIAKILKTRKHKGEKQYLQLFSKSLNTLSYFTQLPFHPSFSVLLKILEFHMISMHIISFQNNSTTFYNSYINCIEQ